MVNRFSAAANQTGQAVLHNVEGTLTVPYTFQENGDYTIQVYLAGTGIIPTIPTDEEATFPITVVPELPARWHSSCYPICTHDNNIHSAC